MKFMATWVIPTEHHRAAAAAFLETGAPMPEGLVALGRWHAPGSRRGWVLCETDDAGLMYEHIAEWSSMLEIEVTPVVDDAEAAAALGRAIALK